MLLSIITINRNDAKGLQKTLDSVRAQAPSLKDAGLEIEHVIVDGASTDDSVDVIKKYESCIVHHQLSISLKWVSEPDKGIYNAMNKGIQIAMGRRVVDNDHHSERSEENSNLYSLISTLPSDHYLQILNSADVLAASDVCVRMLAALKEKNFPDILYGNMIKQWPDGHTYCDRCEGGQLSMLSFYHGTLNHDSAYIRLSLFDKFGMYDESLKIVSDWAWYLRAIPLGGVEPVYVNIDVTIFDMAGVSESNTKLWPIERRPILEREVPRMILADYDKYAFDMRQMDRLRKHHLYPLVYFIERVLFKLEKWHVIK